MNTRLRAVALIIFLAVIGALIWQAVMLREPTYQGRRLRMWLEDAEENDMVYPPSELAIRAMGTSALPVLLSLIRTKDSSFRQALVELHHSQSWLPIHPRPSLEVQGLGIYGFKVLGPSAQPAVPELERLLEAKDPYVRACAAFSLVQIGPAGSNAAPSLVRYLHQLAKTNPGITVNPPEQLCAVCALAELGSAADPAVPEISALTNSASPPLRFAARAALIRIYGESIQPLLDSVRDTSSQTNWFEVAGILDFLGTNAVAAVPELVVELNQPNVLIQNKAVQLLGKIHARPELCIPPLTLFLHSTNNWTRADCLSTLGAFGHATQGSIATLEIRRCLNDPDAWVRKQATNAVRQITGEVDVKP